MADSTISTTQQIRSGKGSKMTATKASKDVVNPATIKASERLLPEMVKSLTWDEDTLRGINSFDDALALVEKTHGKVVEADQVMGDGFTLLSNADKGMLVGLPMLLMDWRFSDGNHGGKMVSIHLLVQNKDRSTSKYIVNDGSTGILEQLAALTIKTGQTGGLIVKRGFRVSEYDVEDEKGNIIQAKTYYLDTSN